METNRRELEAVVERYRKGESVSLGMFYCREAFPTLRKYALDPDPGVRDRVAFFLRLYHEPAALQLLVRQIETYPADPNAFPVSYAAAYPCHFFREVKTPALAQALVTRIKSSGDEFKRDEIYLLGCLSPRDARARAFLEEMGRPSFPLRLDEWERAVFSESVDYALAEAGAEGAEGRVLADIERRSRESDGAERVLENLKQFTNCRILRRYARLLKDRRPWREVTKISDFYDPRYKTDNGLVLLRVADAAALRFASVYGAGVIGLDPGVFEETRPFTDAELERVYRRVTKALDDRKFSACREPS